MTSVDFTVVIPTYNGASRLPPLLEGLRSQTGTSKFNWEIIVVDNNSQDDTADIVARYQQQWSPSWQIRYHPEPKQGLAFARMGGVKAAKAPLVGFLDDDVIPASDWVEQAYQFGIETPEAGAYGGQIHPQFETQPPENFSRVKSLLAIREGGSSPRLYDANSLSLPPGASLVIRKQAWLDSAPQEPQLVGRVNGQMLSGEDYEVLIHMHQKGWQLWYVPTLHSHHQIPSHRLERNYLLSLAKGCGLCVYPLRIIAAENAWQRPVITAKVFLGSLKRWLTHVLEHGRKVQQDPILACEAELWRSSMMSPFFFLRQKFLPTGYN